MLHSTGENVAYEAIVWCIMLCFQWVNAKTYIRMGTSIFEARHEKTNILVSDLVRPNHAVQLQKTVRGLKFRIKEVEGLFYPCSENKGADQVRGYREADLRLCFCICKMLVFS